MPPRATLAPYLFSVVATLALATASQATETVVLNDSTLAGTPSTVANLFLAGEETASWLTATCTGDIVAAQIYWASQFGGAPSQLEQSISFYGPGVYPAASAPLLNQGGANAIVSGPTLVDGIINEFRFLDPPTDSVAIQIPVTSGQTFVLGIEFLNQSSGNAFAPSVTYDQDGCQANTNTVDVLPGGWTDACLAGVTGDWVIRAVIDCDDPPVLVPASGDGARFALVFLLVVLGGSVALLLRVQRGVIDRPLSEE